MHLEDLRTVALIAELGTFTKAAECLQMTQSAVSHRVRQVERELGVTLFVREGGRSRLSEAGARLARLAQEIDEKLTSYTQEFARAEDERELLIGAAAGPAWVMPPLLAEFFERLPFAKVKWVLGDRGEIRARLLHGEIDLGIIDESNIGGGIAGELLEPASYLLAARAGHPLLDLPAPKPRDIAGYPFVDFGSVGRPSFAVAWAALNRVDIRVVLEVNFAPSVLAAICEGIGIGFLSSSAAAAAAEQGLIGIIAAKGTPIVENLYVGYRTAAPLSATASTFLEVFRTGNWRSRVPASTLAASAKERMRWSGPPPRSRRASPDTANRGAG